jgi:transcriptional regulator with XRE-family HTH domain
MLKVESEKKVELAEKEAGLLVRKYRNARGWSQQRLADEAHVDQAIIGRLELGLQFGQPGTIISIARALGMRPGLIFDALADASEAEKLENDPEVLELAGLISRLPPEYRQALKLIIEALPQKEIVPGVDRALTIAEVRGKVERMGEKQDKRKRREPKAKDQNG